MSVFCLTRNFQHRNTYTVRSAAPCFRSESLLIISEGAFLCNPAKAVNIQPFFCYCDPKPYFSKRCFANGMFLATTSWDAKKLQ